MNQLQLIVKKYYCKVTKVSVIVVSVLSKDSVAILRIAPKLM